LLARKYPALQITVLDLPGIVAVARELVTEDRVRFQAGDATTAEYGGAAYDAVLFCGVLHQFDAGAIQRMLAGAHRALRDGGRVMICDVMANETEPPSPFAALFSLQMLLTSESGGVFAASECARWLENTGFSAARIQRLPEPLPYTVIQARRA
jgi:ubiquinone/menaquinone biosynthesis C-methylase UbiE